MPTTNVATVLALGQPECQGSADGREATLQPEDVEALLEPAGRALLASLPAYDDASALALAERLRATGHPPRLVSAALTQSRLRHRARGKLGAAAASLLLTPEGLEQATRAPVARRRARRLASVAGPGAGTVVDLCCGIGADLLAMAAAGLRVTGVDRDPLAVAVARANVAALGLADRVEVVLGEATSFATADAGVVFCDPARRAGGRRALRPDDWSPPWSFLRRLLLEHPAAGAKVAPGIAHELVPGSVEAEWVSVDGEVVEAALWGGALAGPARRTASVLRQDADPDGEPSEVVLTDADVPGEPVPVLAAARAGDAGLPLGRWVLDPDGAVVRAGLVQALAGRADVRLLDPRVAYLTTDDVSAVEPALAARHEVLTAMPFSLKRLRSVLRSLDAGPVEIKKRGSALDPEQLRRQLRLNGGVPLTILLTRVGAAPWAVVARPSS